MTDETVSVICFFCYGKLLFCNVRNAPRGCALRRTRQMSQAIYVSLRPLLNKRHWRENVPKACLKNHFRNLQAPLCGIFYPHSVAVARYAALIRIKSPTNWDLQLTKSLFQTRSNSHIRVSMSDDRIEILLFILLRTAYWAAFNLRTWSS